MSYSDIKIKKRKRANEKSTGAIILLAYFSGIVSFAIMLSVFSIVIMNYHTANSMLQFYVLICSGVSSLIVSLAASMSVKTKRLIYGMAVAIVTGITEFLILLCFNNSGLTGQVYILFPIVIVMGFVGCVIGTNIKKK